MQLPLLALTSTKMLGPHKKLGSTSPILEDYSITEIGNIKGHNSEADGPRNTNIAVDCVLSTFRDHRIQSPLVHKTLNMNQLSIKLNLWRDSQWYRLHKYPTISVTEP